MLRRRAISLLVAALAAAVPAPRPVRAEDLPARVHALLLLRVLAYDRNIRQRAGAALTVVVLQQPGDHGSEQRSAALRAAFEEVSKDVVVAGLAVHVKEVPFHGVAELDAMLETLHAALIEVDVSLTPVLPDLLRLSRHRSTSTSGTRAMAEAGAAIGVAASGGRAALTVNLPGARAEGADLDAALLDICEVIRQ
jgi:hypothetical protein